MNLILEKSSKMPFHTDMNLVFQAINNSQLNYNWLITDIACNAYNEIWPDDTSRPVWRSGAELTRIVQKRRIQFIWGVFSAFEKDVQIDLGKLLVTPYADGNPDFWRGNPKIQYPGAQMEIVCWDSTATLLITEDEKISNDFKLFFPDAEDLRKINELEY